MKPEDKMKAPAEAPILKENADCYIDGGLYVFTEKYLLERGYCCKNGCRHCPYGFKKPAAHAQT